MRRGVQACELFDSRYQIRPRGLGFDLLIMNLVILAWLVCFVMLLKADLLKSFIIAVKHKLKCAFDAVTLIFEIIPLVFVLNICIHSQITCKLIPP